LIFGKISFLVSYQLGTNIQEYIIV